MGSEKPHHNHPSALVGPPCTCIFPPHGLAVKMQGRGSILQKIDTRYVQITSIGAESICQQHLYLVVGPIDSIVTLPNRRRPIDVESG